MSGTRRWRKKIALHPKQRPMPRAGECLIALTLLTGAEISAAQRLRAKRWSVKGIAKHTGLPVEGLKALFGITGDLA